MSAMWSAGNGPRLLTIQGLDPIYTDFTVAEPDLPLVRRYLGGPNVKVETKSEDDNIPARTGDLYFIDNAVQPGAGTVKARAVTPNPDRALWPSQFVRVRLILDILKEARLVPSGAVQIGQNGPYVFVVKPDSTLDLRQVKPGQRQGDLMVITDGVKPGETVVVSGQLQLAPGTKVVAQPMETPRDGSSAAGNAASELETSMIDSGNNDEPNSDGDLNQDGNGAAESRRGKAASSVEIRQTGNRRRRPSSSSFRPAFRSRSSGGR